MKLRPLPSLCAALLALCPILANAQTSAVPNFISYQGYVVDASGNAIGADAPVNRTVIFRIWDHQSSSEELNLIYSEQQVVTISDGEFSVLVGQGVANTLDSFGYSESPKKEAGLSNAFEGSGRFLGVTVASNDPIATTDNEISPRQQIVSTAFAMRAKEAESAKFAESIGSSSDLRFSPISGTASNYGLGWYGTDRPFSGTAVDGPVLYGNAGGALGSNAEGSQNTALRWDASGRVGIGATSFKTNTSKLTLQGDMATTPADQLTIQGDSDNNKQLLLGYNTTANLATIQSKSSSANGSGLILNPEGGNVGIGATSFKTNTNKLTLQGDMATTPGDQLTIQGNSDNNQQLLLGYNTTDNQATIQSMGPSAAGPSPTSARLKVNPMGGYVEFGGNVGIGGIGAAMLYVEGGSLVASVPSGPYFDDSSGGIKRIVGVRSRSIGIWANQAILSQTGFFVTSDARLKNIKGVSNGEADLQTLLGIEITDFRYRDTKGKGDATQKKVIAQQVEKVFPLAVTQTTSDIPDIYRMAAMVEGWIKLKTPLKKGDRVRLIDNQSDEIYEVLEVKEDGFRTSYQSVEDEVFVFGREVSDLRIVDYEAISMLNVSATQELKREKDAEFQALRDENAALRRDLAAKNASLEARLIALERSMPK